ncbi:MAG: flavodoxin-dependent (E)-4-hydroxy-3-methylbut-2-enyl-diphosphate synthase, partial [Synergistaceae bacterium]|nr:flavodoxin-dependent (E)-4-hydroxy-3-methylbut-2-enyl-diphosphate synthase [Synergistaceae bacterium]
MTKKLTIGTLTLGGTAPVRVESMLKIPLSRREECLAQCISLHQEGCELIRAAYPSSELKGDLEWLKGRSPVPLMADIHFDPALALEALEAGLPSLRINPGNMPLGKLREVVRSAGERGAVIRIGANGG